MKRVGSPDRSLRRTLRKWKHLSAALLPFAKPHRGWLIAGGIAALVVVAARLALPWPLQALLQPWIHGGAAAGSVPSPTSTPSWLPTGVDPALAMGSLFLLFLLVLGLADLLERVYFARFAIAATRDLRAAAFRAAIQTDPKTRSLKPGDLVARLVGDSARIKAGLKGFLVHVATNGVLLLGVTSVLFWMDVRLGLIFAIAGLLTLAVTLLSARRIYESALKYRKKEGQRADAIQQALVAGPYEGAFAGMSDSPGYHKAELTRLQGVATWITHGIFGMAVLASFWVGAKAVAAGRLDAGHIVVFTMYALMMRGPIVRLARQGARTGKILAGSNRLLSPIRKANAARGLLGGGPTVGPLRHHIRLFEVLVRSPKSQGRRFRLGPLSAEFAAGEKIALIGPPGSGKTTLLELIAGLRKPRAGTVSWDSFNIAKVNAWDLAAHVAYLPQQPEWLQKSIRELLELPPQGDADARTLELLHACSVDSLLARLPDGLETVIGSDDVSPGERRTLALARLARQGGSVRLLDDPVAGLPAEIAQQALTAAVRLQSSALVIVAMSAPVAIELFDRVIALDVGRVEFDGDTAGFLRWIKSSAKGAPRRDLSINLRVGGGA